ncbi:cytochrome-c oxidase, cbb3-type subunit I [bacterium]|jgi:cytochrome c oxidase cbb3-type subunit I/II|nr:cytochrome-c oxidase, cbb3-type subunit I [bacterium]
MNNHPQTHPPKNDTFQYDDSIVKKFIIATIGWGFVALLVGVVLATQLANWTFNFDLSWITFGRLRPLHTNAAIFAFAGNAIFAGIYHSSQRLLKTRMFSDVLSKIHFWGWQLIIVSAAITLPLGITAGKEYAELEWPIDILIALIWVIFAINYFLTLKVRRERHIYVAIWFYIATIITVAILHIVNSLAIPVGLFKSYSLFSGVQDALVQWWYGHNAVAFFLTTPFLGLMYYYIPKIIKRPVYSYRLSIIHFWALVFIYIWAGPHHLLYSVLPEWAQTMGVVFSVMLLAPSWGGMINGLLTLRGSWDRVRKEPILKFLVASLTLYGMATFEGPLLAFKSVNALAHFTDWIIGHVHSGVLGWNGFMIFALLYYCVPKLWKTKLYSDKLATTHFWVATVGIILYIMSMWASGITQGLMWLGLEDGRLIYPDFVETVTKIIPLYYVRLVGGLLYLSGYLLMIYNLVKTIASAPKNQTSPSYSAPALQKVEHDNNTSESSHRWLEREPDILTILVIVAVAVGSIIEIIPSLTSHKYVALETNKKPYSALELAGRDIYIREGCYTCHSQMVRPIKAEVLRYGAKSELDDSIYDHPFQWGSRRIGPDLARVGGKYPDIWHYRHMDDPRSMAPGSIMPNYPWLLENNLDYGLLEKKLRVMQTLGVPYSDENAENAIEDAKAQALEIGKNLDPSIDAKKISKKEIIALIAYLQSLKEQLHHEPLHGATH